jgi:A/G-specific adenine glycosylase
VLFSIPVFHSVINFKGLHLAYRFNLRHNLVLNMNHPQLTQKRFSDHVLDWYEKNARSLPWRSPPGEKPDPYHVWLSEIMLQQTTVPTVGPYFDKFLNAWPTVRHMAAAPLDDILTAWAGLGYYARARNLHKCAAVVTAEYGGRFPDELDLLLSLPGIGPYTAAAISAIAFNKPSTVVDGNIERIITRQFRIKEALPAAKKPITEHAARLTPDDRAGDYAQALMDIGSGICTPRNPRCVLCPVCTFCEAFAEGDMEQYPVKAPKKVKPIRQAFIFWVERPDGYVLLRRREEKGLLGGMMEFPSTDWQESAVNGALALDRFLAEFSLDGEQDMAGARPVRHTFTHFHLDLTIIKITTKKNSNTVRESCQWQHPDKFNEVALPTLMMKVAQSVQESQRLL